MEEELRRSEALQSEGQRLSHTGSWSWHIPSGTVVWSDEHFRIFGFTPGEVEPSLELIVNCIHPDDRPIMQASIANAMREVGHGVFEVAGDPCELPMEWKWMRDLSIKTGVPMSCELVQIASKTNEWQEILKLTDEANAAGAKIWVQVSNRTIGSVMSWKSGHHPFVTRRSWREIRSSGWAGQLAVLRALSFREKLLSDSVERPQFDSGYFADQLLGGWDVQFPVTADMDYEPTWESSVAGLAARERRDPAAVAYDVRMANEGTGLLPSVVPGADRVARRQVPRV